MTEQKALQNLILTDAKTLEAAFHIHGNWANTSKMLFEKLRGRLQSYAQEKGLYLDWYLPMESQRYVGLRFKYDKNNNFALTFQFEGAKLTNLIWGISRSFAEPNKKDFAEPEKVERIRALWSLNRSELNKKSMWWPWYTSDPLPKLTLEYSDWNKHATPWLDLLSLQHGDESAFAEAMVEVADCFVQVRDELQPIFQS